MNLKSITMSTFKDLLNKDCEEWYSSIDVTLDKTGVVTQFESDGDETLSDVQNLVYKLIKKGYVEPEKVVGTLVIVIEPIDDTDNLYLETYHDLENGPEDPDCVVLFDQKFLDYILDENT